ncbi:unnamed protein product, partial [Sphenostylis stenocarpa]
MPARIFLGKNQGSLLDRKPQKNVAGLPPILTRAQKAKKMEQLEEQNRKLATELNTLKEQMAQMLEMMRQQNLHKEGD